MKRHPVEAGGEQAEAKSRGNLIRRGVRWIGALGSVALIAGGSYLMFRNNNMDDFGDLKAFTSAEHQGDKCNTQAAFDAQVKIHNHFEEEGGLTDEQAQAMAPVVGLEPDEMKSLVGTELFPMDYDCGVPVASSQEATEGLAMVALAGGALIGAGVVAATKRRG